MVWESGMRWFEGFLRRRRPVTTWADVETFVDENAAFVVNRSMYEYSRARAGILAEKLFREEAFKAAIEEGRWRAFPIGVGNISELVEGMLRPRANGREGELLEAVVAVSHTVQGRYATPKGFDAGFWGLARESVERRLRLATLAQPKPPQYVPDATFPEMFALVPIHPEVAKLDFEVVRNQVRGMMLNIASEFERRADVAALVGALSARS